MHIEQSRKHGPFDRRYPPIRHKPAPASLGRLGEERLHWQGFLARLFPDSRRHDFDALAAYESYVNDVEGRPADGSSARALGASGAANTARSEPTQRDDDEQEPPATPDTERWEGDGGASIARRDEHEGVSDQSEPQRLTPRDAAPRPRVEIDRAADHRFQS